MVRIIIISKYTSHKLKIFFFLSFYKYLPTIIKESPVKKVGCFICNYIKIFQSTKNECHKYEDWKCLCDIIIIWTKQVIRLCGIELLSFTRVKELKLVNETSTRDNYRNKGKQFFSSGLSRPWIVFLLSCNHCFLWRYYLKTL